MAESLLCLLSTALGLAAVEQPAEADSEEFFDNVLTMLGEPCLLDCIAALTQHKQGALDHEATLRRLVVLLKARPHLLCGLSMWVPADKVQAACTPTYLELRAGVLDTMSRSRAGERPVTT